MGQSTSPSELSLLVGNADPHLIQSYKVPQHMSPHKNYPFSWGNVDPRLIQSSPAPKRHLDRFTRFCTPHPCAQRGDHAT